MNHYKLAFQRLVIATLFTSVLISSATADQPATKNGKTAKAASSPTRWEATIKKFETIDATMPPPQGAVLLVGGSNARRWTDVDDYFPNHQLINRGFGGARLSDILHFADRIVLPYKPKTIVINAGGNDLSSGKSPEQIRDTARELIAKIQVALPDTRIYYLGLPLVRRASDASEVRATILAMNGLLADLAASEANVEFIDLVPAFLDHQGQFRPDLFVEDGTHFSPQGYAIITKLLHGKF